MLVDGCLVHGAARCIWLATRQGCLGGGYAVIRPLFGTRDGDEERAGACSTQMGREWRNRRWRRDGRRAPAHSRPVSGHQTNKMYCNTVQGSREAEGRRWITELRRRKSLNEHALPCASRYVAPPSPLPISPPPFPPLHTALKLSVRGLHAPLLSVCLIVCT